MLVPQVLIADFFLVLVALAWLGAGVLQVRRLVAVRNDLLGVLYILPCVLRRELP